MSADNFLTIRKTKNGYAIYDGNASSGHTWLREEHKSRDEAIDKAIDIIQEEIIEYGILYIDK